MIVLVLDSSAKGTSCFHNFSHAASPFSFALVTILFFKLHIENAVTCIYTLTPSLEFIV